MRADRLRISNFKFQISNLRFGILDCGFQMSKILGKKQVSRDLLQQIRVRQSEIRNRSALQSCFCPYTLYLRMNSEILIIGGGVIGLSIARELHKNGRQRITVVDRGRIGGEASWAAAGMLAPNIETDTSEDFHRFGIESLELYPRFAAELLEETGVDIELDRSGTLCLAFDESESAELL